MSILYHQQNIINIVNSQNTARPYFQQHQVILESSKLVEKVI